jgi:hypothetical protein
MKEKFETGRGKRADGLKAAARSKSTLRWMPAALN